VFLSEVFIRVPFEFFFEFQVFLGFFRVFWVSGAPAGEK
jgi:hypothetical protein